MKKQSEEIIHMEQDARLDKKYTLATREEKAKDIVTMEGKAKDMRLRYTNVEGIISKLELSDLRKGKNKNGDSASH